MKLSKQTFDAIEHEAYRKVNHSGLPTTVVVYRDQYGIQDEYFDAVGYADGYCRNRIAALPKKHRAVLTALPDRWFNNGLAALS